MAAYRARRRTIFCSQSKPRSIHPLQPYLSIYLFSVPPNTNPYTYTSENAVYFSSSIETFPASKSAESRMEGKTTHTSVMAFFHPPPPPCFFFFYSSKCNPRGLQTSSLLQTMKCLIKQQHDRACGTGRLLMCTQSFRWVNIYLDEPLAWQPNSISGRRPPPPSPAFWVIPYRLYVAFAPWRHFTLSHRELISSIENQLARFQENGEISLHKSLFFYYYFFPSSSLSPSECR